MKHKTFQQARAAVVFFIGALVSVASLRDNFVLAVTAVVVGMAVLVFMRSRARIPTDERDIIIQEKSARFAYAVIAPVLGISSVVFLFPSKSGLTVFSKGEFLFVESVGYIFAYLTLFLLLVYAVSYRYFSGKYGGNGHEQ